MEHSIRHHYEKDGVVNFYKKHGSIYCNPHEEGIKKAVNVWINENERPSKIIDLACGGGEVTRVFQPLGTTILGIDPFTTELYEKRTGLKALPLSFENIEENGLPENLKADAIFCSFALHLTEESRLPRLLWQLSQAAKKLVVITPHKKPNINCFWDLQSEYYDDTHRVRMRTYQSRY